MDDRIRAAFDAIHAEEALKEHTKAALAARPVSYTHLTLPTIA